MLKQNETKTYELIMSCIYQKGRLWTNKRQFQKPEYSCIQMAHRQHKFANTVPEQQVNVEKSVKQLLNRMYSEQQGCDTHSQLENPSSS